MGSMQRRNYSPHELKFLDMLTKAKGNPVSSATMAEKIYSKDRHTSLLFARQSVNVTMRSLIGKVKDNKEPFTIARTERNGPHPIEYKRVEK